MKARRSCLSVPGSSERMLAKAAALPADEVVIDLEDGVAAADKARARELVASVLDGGALAGAAVRVNAPGGDWFEADVAELAGRAGSLVIPKVDSAAELAQVDIAVPRGTRLQALVETAAGLQSAGEIAAASPRLDALILGYADLAASLGRGPGADVPELWLHAQDSVLVAARAAGIQAIDGPHLAIRDDAGLRRWAAHARTLGFDGKWAVHPGQLAAINAAFTPAPDELERAAAVVAALADGSPGAVELDGEMIDEAIRKQALATVARGRAAGLG
ncbi:MAG: CoA ester lyase [Thermoleophilaceae bacterium]|nr:CoA ester lyase [Thermoleophilaceae bacterium]